MKHKITSSGIGIINEVTKENTFPLFTKKALAERWGVKPNVVTNWATRHTTKPDHFPEPIEGIVAGGGPYYPLYEVERYEKARKLK